MATVAKHFIDRVGALLSARSRVMLGLTGAPGSGKSTLAEALLEAFADRSIVVPMDGYHLANVELQRLGLAGRKGAPETFDAAGYVALLRRIREQRPDEIVYAPEFRRAIEEPIAGAIPVHSSVRLIITEGNYLLLQDGAWADIVGLLDEIWYVDVDPSLRVQRLIDRHMHFGRSRSAAEEWVHSSDEKNARLIETTRSRAHAVYRW